jgi:hypothetical protein
MLPTSTEHYLLTYRTVFYFQNLLHTGTLQLQLTSLLDF